MSETWAAEQEAALGTISSAGELLRRSREAAGLHVAALAVSLKVPVRKLEALEDNRFDDAGDTVFVRALASSICRTLRIDPQPVLERLPRGAQPRLVRDNEGINTPFRAPSDGAPPGWADYMKRPVFLVVAALLLGALVIMVLPLAQMERPVRPAKTEAPAAVPAALPDMAASQPPAILPSAMSAAPASRAAVAVAMAPVPTPDASSAAVAPAGGLVAFRTGAESWVEVIDAKGVVTLRRLMMPGESATASGLLPLQVTIGRADTTQVQVRGKTFDLQPVSRDNVARFEVK